jgi:UDP-N-acetylglucosamine diphosphorylase / glucose-1-phosphate thymidylyltransferase / UDP-N-acetylgalactosamine diphosphorylase / glucosamine-1-phosphate N-acetyltransferase / galactosamine-1-phosphate N-acetyltransferase
MILVMPMAGRGSRFNGSGYGKPKPLIEVNGKPMFVHALESVNNIERSKTVIITLKEHEEYFGVAALIKEYIPYTVELVVIDGVTQGQLCTVIAAREHFEKDEDILVVSSDTIIESNMAADIKQKSLDCKGLISVCNMPGAQWSFAKTDDLGKVIEVAEKVRISDHASTGLYYFSNGLQLCKIADKLIADDERTKGEFYVIPAYQKLIDNGEFVGISIASKMWDLGTPEALNYFLKEHKTN